MSPAVKVNWPDPVSPFTKDFNLKGELATTTALLALNIKFESLKILKFYQYKG